MTRIYLPSEGPAGWKRLLAQPDLHWKQGASAMTLAASWEAADGNLPPEIRELITSSAALDMEGAELLVALPEFKVSLPGGSRPTQSDVFALVRGASGLAACAVEGKVEESFGPTVEERGREGAEARVAWLHKFLGLPGESGGLRYQLLHRTAAAVLLAQRFGARIGMMLVHSFSPGQTGFRDFQTFAAAMGASAEAGTLAHVGRRDGIELYLGWATGDQRFRQDVVGTDVSSEQMA